MRTAVVLFALALGARVVAAQPAPVVEEAAVEEAAVEEAAVEEAPIDATTVDAAPAESPAKVELQVHHRLGTAVFIVAGGLVWAGSDRLFQDTLAPSSCRLWCEPVVNGFDYRVGKALLWDDRDTPQLISDAAAYVAVPVVAFGGLALAAAQQGDRSKFLDDALIVGEVTVVTGLLNRLTALTVGRTRPRTRTALPGSSDALSRQAHESFFSGHTSAAFSVGVAAAQVASLRGYRVAPWMWASAFVFGTTTGVMRLAGADHHPSDVIVGAAVATVLGVTLPRLHRKRIHVDAAPKDDGAVVSLGTTW